MQCIIYSNRYREIDIIKKFSLSNISKELIINSEMKAMNVINIKNSIYNNTFLSKADLVMKIIDENFSKKESILVGTAGFSFDTIKEILSQILFKEYLRDFKILISVNNHLNEIIIENVDKIEQIEQLIIKLNNLSKPNEDFKLRW